MHRYIASLICFMLLLPLALGLCSITASAQEDTDAAIDNYGETDSADDMDNEGERREPDIAADDADAMETPDAPDEYASEVDGAPPLAALRLFSAEQVDVVGSWDDLLTWMTGHKFTGGSVALNADIAVSSTNTNDNNFYSQQPVFIDTREFSIVVPDGATLYVFGDINIKGLGINQPVLHVRGGGTLVNYANVKSPFTVTSTGDYGFALRFDSGALYSARDSSAIITAGGANAVALQSDVPLELAYHSVYAPGAGGRAIVCAEDVALYLSRVSAACAPIEAPGVTLDTCSVYPSVNGASVINRRISRIESYFTPSPLMVGDAVPTAFYGNIYLGNEAAPDDIEIETAIMDLADAGRVFDAPGVYALLVVLPHVFDGLDVSPADGAPVYYVKVYDPKLPFFEEARFYPRNNPLAPDGGTRDDYYTFKFRYEGDSLSTLTLWRSDDNGTTWRISWQEGYAQNEPINVTWKNKYITLEYASDRVSDAMLFAFEAQGLGGSHVVRIVFSDITTAGAHGGDRDGGDRLPWSLFTAHLGIGGEDGGGDGNGGNSSSGSASGNTGDGNVGNGGDSGGSGTINSGGNLGAYSGSGYYGNIWMGGYYGGSIGDSIAEGWAATSLADLITDPGHTELGIAGTPHASNNAEANGNTEDGNAKDSNAAAASLQTDAARREETYEGKPANNAEKDGAHASTVTDTPAKEDGAPTAAEPAGLGAPQDAFPYIPVYAGVLGAGGAGALVYLLRIRHLKQRI